MALSGAKPPPNVVLKTTDRKYAKCHKCGLYGDTIYFNTQNVCGFCELEPVYSTYVNEDLIRSDYKIEHPVKTVVRFIITADRLKGSDKFQDLIPLVQNGEFVLTTRAFEYDDGYLIELYSTEIVDD